MKYYNPGAGLLQLKYYRRSYGLVNICQVILVTFDLFSLWGVFPCTERKILKKKRETLIQYVQILFTLKYVCPPKIFIVAYFNKNQ